MCVSVYVSRANDEGQPWQLFARHKAHYGKIEGTIYDTIFIPGIPPEQNPIWVLNDIHRLLIKLWL